MREPLFAVLLFALAGADARAQEPPGPGGPPTVRARLRNGDSVQGYLRGRSADELVVFTNDGRYRHLAFAEVQAFEVRGRTGSHVKRGALVGALVWASVITAAAIGSLDDAGVASWQSGAILAASTGLGAAIGAGVPRYGWRSADPHAAGVASRPPPGIRLALRF
jgi:hypothetical protein